MIHYSPKFSSDFVACIRSIKNQKSSNNYAKALINADADELLDLSLLIIRQFLLSDTKVIIVHDRSDIKLSKAMYSNKKQIQNFVHVDSLPKTMLSLKKTSFNNLMLVFVNLDEQRLANLEYYRKPFIITINLKQSLRYQAHEHGLYKFDKGYSL